MKFHHFNRRLHLYLGLTLLPWFFMYGISSIPFAHNEFFQKRDAASGQPLWTPWLEKPLDLAVPQDPEALRGFAAAVLKEAGVSAPTFGAYRPNPKQVNVYASSFWKAIQIRYFVDDKKMIAENRRFRWDQFLTGMHARGGFEQDGLIQDSWGIVIDIVCVAIVLWIASGIYMWWGIRGQRGWGLLAIGGGILSFVLFVAFL